MAIEIKYENGKIEIINHLDYRSNPVILSSLEKDAITKIYDCIHRTGHNPKDLHLERRTTSYLSVFLSDIYDVCRIKCSERTMWISIRVCNDDIDALKNDPRLSDVKNKNQAHWKIYLNNINDISNFEDLIDRSCYAFETKYENL